VTTGISERQEEQEHVRPHHRAADPRRRAQQMVMVVPIDRDEREGKNVDEQARHRVAESRERGTVRRPELQREDRDDDGHHAVAERL
jgi:hypothetical protein